MRRCVFIYDCIELCFSLPPLSWQVIKDYIATVRQLVFYLLLRNFRVEQSQVFKTEINTAGNFVQKLFLKKRSNQWQIIEHSEAYTNDNATEEKCNREIKRCSVQKD